MTITQLQAHITNDPHWNYGVLQNLSNLPTQITRALFMPRNLISKLTGQRGAYPGVKASKRQKRKKTYRPFQFHLNYPLSGAATPNLIHLRHSSVVTV